MDIDRSDSEGRLVYRACWLFVRRLAKKLQSEDFDIMAVEMEPQDYGGSFDPAVFERWKSIWENEVKAFHMSIVARFIQEEGPWGRGDEKVTRDIAEQLRSRDSEALTMWNESLSEASTPQR